MGRLQTTRDVHNHVLYIEEVRLPRRSYNPCSWSATAKLQAQPAPAVHGVRRVAGVAVGEVPLGLLDLR